MNTITQNQAFTQFCNELSEITKGKRGWLSITKAARTTNMSKQALKAVAEAYGLTCQNHGKHGLTAWKDHMQLRNPQDTCGVCGCKHPNGTHCLDYVD